MRASANVARRFAIAAGAAAALLLSGCAAGQIAETAQEQASLDGVHGTVGDITLVAYLRAPFAAPCFLPGASVPLSLVIANSGRQPDTLESVSSPRFASTTVAATGDDAAKALTAASGSGTCGGTAAPVSSAPGAPGAAPPPASLPTLGANSSTKLGVTAAQGAQDLGENPVVLLQGLKDGALYPGNSVQVTLTFQRAGTLTVAVPVRLSLVPSTVKVPTPTTGGE